MTVVCTQKLFSHPQQSRTTLISLTSWGALCEKEERTDSVHCSNVESLHRSLLPLTRACQTHKRIANTAASEREKMHSWFRSWISTRHQAHLATARNSTKIPQRWKNKIKSTYTLLESWEEIKWCLLNWHASKGQYLSFTLSVIHIKKIKLSEMFIQEWIKRLNQIGFIW